jgi:hypothetical protein
MSHDAECPAVTTLRMAADWTEKGQDLTAEQLTHLFRTLASEFVWLHEHIEAIDSSLDALEARDA